MIYKRWTKVELYFLYWIGYLFVFTIVQGLTERDFFTVFRNESISLVPKVFFVAIVVSKPMFDLLFNKQYARFITIYILLVTIFALLLRIVDNYIILKYFLINWKKEPLLSVAPFLYNAIKLQFVLSIPFSVRLYQHLHKESEHRISPGEIMAGDQEDQFLSVKCERRMIKLHFSDICYFEAQGNYLMIFTTNGVFKTYLSISELEDKLPKPLFARVHRSFIIALNKIESHNSSQVVIGSTKIPIGRSYSLKVREALA